MYSCPGFLLIFCTPVTDLIPILLLTDKKINGQSGRVRCNTYYTSLSVYVCVYMFQRLVFLDMVQMTKKENELKSNALKQV